MSRKDLYKNLPPINPSEHATEALNSILASHPKNILPPFLSDAKKEEERALEAQTLAELPPQESRVDVRHAVSGGSLLEHTSNRTELRLLVLSRDATVLKTGSLTQHRLLELSQMFAEIHIILLCERGEGTRATVRLGNNVWIYPTNSRYWWQTGFDAYRVANEQLNFAQGFRADLIIAEDPFESGVAAHFLAGKYQRPFQVHIYDDFYDRAFKEADENNWYRILMAKFVLRHVDCVRTKTESLRDRIVEKYKDLEPLTEVLPMYHNLSAWRDFIPTFDLHVRYPQFKFIMLHISAMTALSHTDHVINGCLHVLKQYPTVGLIIVGNGPYRSVYEKHVISMGLQNQVVFEPMPSEVVSHMKSANILLHLSEDSSEEDLILQAAAAKLPMIAGALGLGGELFLDGESAFICTNNDSICVGEKINKFLNGNLLRSEFGINAQQIVFERIEQDFGAYLTAYEQSIQRCLTNGS